MEPQDDHFTGEQYNQLENFLMEGKEFPLLELPESNASHSNNNPSHLQQGESNRDKMTRDANSGGHVTNAQHTISPTDNNDCLPSEFSDHTAQPKNKGLSSSGNSTSSMKITYKVQPPGPGIQPVWSSPAQTSIFGKPVGAGSSPNNPPPSAPTTAHLDKYSNPIQPLKGNNNTNSGQISTSPSPASASTHQPQIINPPPIPVVVSPNNMPPPQVPCNNNDNNTLQAPANTNYVQPSTNDNHLQHSQQNHNNYEGYDQLAPPPNPYPPAVVDQLVANTNTSSSSIAFRFAATMQGASTGNMRTQYPLPSGTPPSGFMSFQQQCVSYVQGGAQMVDAASSGNGAVQTPFPPHMALAGGGGGGQETGLLPMYSTASFHDLALMAQRINNKNDNSARKKQQRQEGSATKNPRGRPKGSVSKKRNPAPQWEDVRYDLHELEQHAKKPYNVRRAEWQDLKQAGALTAASRAQMMSNSLPAGGGDQQMAAFEGVQAAAGWSNYPLPMNNNPSSYDRQGQDGDLPAVGIPNPNHVHLQPPTAQFGNAASEVVHPAPPISHGRTASMTFGDAAPSSADNGISMPADQNPSKFWSFGTNNPPGTMMPFRSQNAFNNGNDQNMIIIHPGSAEQKGKQAIENHMSLLQSGSSVPSVVPVDVPSRNNSCVEFGTAGSSCNTDQDQFARGTNIDNNPNTVNHVGGMMRSNDQSAREPQAVVAANNNNTFWCGRHQSTYINFENGCYGVSVQGQGRATNSEGTNRTSAAPSLYDAASAAQGNTSPCNKQPFGSSTNYAATSTQNTAVETNYSNNPTLNHNTSVEPMLMPPANNQLVAVSDQYSISVSDYFSDYDGMQLTDEDGIACALREQIIAQPTAQPIQQQQQQHVTPLPTHFSSLHHPMPGGVVVEQQAIEHQISCQVPATPIIPQTIPSGVAPGQQVWTWGASQNNNNSFGQAAQTFSEYPPLQSNFQPNLFAQYQPAQDGRGSEHQAYMQQNNNHDHANNAALDHQQLPTAHQTTRSQNIPRITGPTYFFNYQHRLQQQQQADPPVDEPRPYAMPPPPGSGYMINTPLMQQHYYQYGGNGDLRPPKTTRRRQTQPHYPVIDFNQCAVTPAMFQEMVNDGSVDSVLGSDLWAGLNQDAYSIMVTADPTLVLDPGRLQERIARLNSGMLPIPNLLNCLRMNTTGYSAPQAANRLMGNNNMMNYAPPTGMQQNPTIQQGHGVATGAENYNFPDPNARVTHLLMNANNIPSVQYQYQYQQQPNNLQVAQMNVNMQKGQPNFGYWHEYPAPPSSGQRLEEMMQLVPVNQPSMQDNVNYNPPFSSSFASGIPQLQHAAPPPNTLQALNQAYNNTMHGVPYASGGPVCSTSANEK